MFGRWTHEMLWPVLSDRVGSISERDNPITTGLPLLIGRRVKDERTMVKYGAELVNFGCRTSEHAFSCLSLPPSTDSEDCLVD